MSHHEIAANVGKTTDEKVESVVVKSDIADDVTPAPCLTSVFHDGCSLKRAAVSDRCHSSGTNRVKLCYVFIGHKT